MNTLEKVISSDIIQALGWAVLHSIWQGMAIALVILLLLAIGKPLSAHIKYVLYATGLLAMLACLGVTFAHTYITLQAVPPEFSPGHLTHFSFLVPSTAEVYAENALPLSTRAALVLQDNVGLITLCWLLGAVLFSLRLFGGLYYTRSMLRNGAHEISGEWAQKLESMAARLRVRKSIRLLGSVLAGTPMVIGHLKPVILLPAGLLTGLSTAQVEAVLAHELAHIRRNDWLVNLLQSVVETLFFFHPVVWWLSSGVREEREKCCDDIAVQITGDAFGYVKTLSAIQEVKGSSPAMAMAFGKKKYLLERVKRLVSGDHEEKAFSAKLIVLLTVVVSITAVAFIFKQEKPQKDRPEVLQSEIPPGLSGREETLSGTRFDQDTLSENENQQETITKEENEEKKDKEETASGWEDSSWEEEETVHEDFYLFDLPEPLLPPGLDSLLLNHPDIDNFPPALFGFDDFDASRFGMPFELFFHGGALHGLPFQDTVIFDSLSMDRNDSSFNQIKEEMLEARRLSQEAREAYLEKVNAYREKIREHQHKLRVLQQSYQQELREYQEGIRKEQKERRDHQRKLQEKQMEAMREAQEGHLRQLEEMRKKQEALHLKNEKFTEDLRRELEADELINKGGPIDFRYDANKDELKVNGKKLNKKQKDKYKELLEQYDNLSESGLFRYQNN